MPRVKGHLRDGRWVRGHYQPPLWFSRWGLVATVATNTTVQRGFWRVMGFLWLVIGVFVGGVILVAALSKVADRTLRDPSMVPIDEAPDPAPVRVRPPRSARHRERREASESDGVERAATVPGDAGAPHSHGHRRHRHHRD